MESKHTKGNWQYDQRREPENSSIPFAIQLMGNGWCEPIADICAFPPNTKENLERMEANAAHIVKCVNNHDELVKALKEVTDQLEVFSDMDVTNKKPMNEAIKNAKALLNTI